MVGIGGDDELPPAHAQQVVLAHEPVDAFCVHLPAAPAQFLGYPRAPVAGPFQADLLNRVSQIHVAIRVRLGVVETVEAGPGNPAQLYHAFHRQYASSLHFFLDPLVDGGFPVKACSIRCSSMRCKHPFKKSISSACWPTFRSNSAIRPSDQRGLPWPGNTFPGPCRTPPRPRCSTFGFTSNARAASVIETPCSSRRTAASLNSFVNCLRDNPMTQFSIRWILSLNRLSQKSGQVQ